MEAIMILMGIYFLLQVLLMYAIYMKLSKDLKKIKSYIWMAHWKGVHKVEEIVENTSTEAKEKKGRK